MMGAMAFDRPNSRAFEQQEIIEKAASKAEAVLSEEAIDPHDFEDLYTQAGVREDLDYVAERQRDFAKNNSPEDNEAARAAKIAEVTLGEGIGLHDWMGPSAYFVVPSAYDDLKNGIDGLVEFEEEEKDSKRIQASHLGLAIDATYRQDSESKLYTIRDKIVEGDPMVMKYFTSQALDFRGQLGSIPHAVAAFDYQTIARLAELWLNKDKKALASDPVQFQVLEQFIAQCELFEKVAGPDRPNLRRNYEHGRELLKEIYRERVKEVEDTGVRDTNSYRLLNEVDRLKRELS